MTPFEKLLVAHLVGDWILAQTDWEAMNKVKDWFACFTHAAKWTIGMWIAMGFIIGWDTPAGKPITLIALMGVLHAIIDRRWPVLWLIRIKEYIPFGRPQERREPPFWLVVCVDQVLHIVQVAVIAQLLSA